MMIAYQFRSDTVSSMFLLLCRSFVSNITSNYWCQEKRGRKVKPSSQFVALTAPCHAARNRLVCIISSCQAAVKKACSSLSFATHCELGLSNFVEPMKIWYQHL